MIGTFQFEFYFIECKTLRIFALRRMEKSLWSPKNCIETPYGLSQTRTNIRILSLKYYLV